MSQHDYARRRAAHQLGFFAECDYPGGYVDGKLITLEMLQACQALGTEPMRASLISAEVVYSRAGDLQPLVDGSAVYPEGNRARNMRDFFTAMGLQAHYFGPQSLRQPDPFLRAHATAQCVLFAGRALLAYNRCSSRARSSFSRPSRVPSCSRSTSYSAQVSS